MMGLATEHGEEKTVMLDASYLKAHRTATSMGIKKGAWTPDRSTKWGMNTKLHDVVYRAFLNFALIVDMIKC